MRITFHSVDKPKPDDRYFTVGWDDTDRAVMVTDDPRAIVGPEGKPIPDVFDAFFDAFEEACAKIWGAGWKRGIETSFDLSSGIVRSWRRGQNIPPPVIVAWVAYIATRQDARGIGELLVALPAGGDVDTAVAAHRAINS